MVIYFILFVATAIFIFASDAVIDGVTEIFRSISRLIWKTNSVSASAPSGARRRAAGAHQHDGVPSDQSPGQSSDFYRGQSASQIREEQERDLSISLLHDEVKVLEKEETKLKDIKKKLEVDIEEQEKIAGMAKHRISAFGADNPKIHKALEDATTLLEKLQADFQEISKSVEELNSRLMDKRAILVCLQN